MNLDRKFTVRKADFLYRLIKILQRVGGEAKSSVVKLIYAFERRPHLKALLDFTEIAVRTFNRQFEGQFRKSNNRKG